MVLYEYNSFSGKNLVSSTGVRRTRFRIFETPDTRNKLIYYSSILIHNNRQKNVVCIAIYVYTFFVESFYINWNVSYLIAIKNS